MKKKKLVIFALAAISTAALSAAIGCSTNEEGHNHSYSIGSNSASHFEECSGCGDKKNYQNHVDLLNNDTKATEPDGKCDICGYQMSNPPAPKTKYKVTFDMKGHGSAIAEQEVEEGSKATKPATDPTDADYDFKGWYSDSECNNEFNFNSAITSATTIYAKWEAKTVAPKTKYKVIFDMKGHGSAPAEQEVEEGSKATEPTTEPTDANYDFVGWYSDPDCADEFNFNSEITSDTTIYAKWELKIRTVTFDMKGVGTAPDVQNVKHGETATRPETDPTEEGFTFVNWYSDHDCTIEFDFKNTVIEANTVVYAKWDVDVVVGKVAVVFDMNGMTATGNSPHHQIVNDGEKATKPEADPTAENCTFGGWFADEECETEFDFDVAVTGTQVTVYAKWNKIPGYFADAPKTLDKGVEGVLTFNNNDNLYFTFTATVKGRYTVSFAPADSGCTLVTDKVILNGNFDLNANETVTITLIRPDGFGADSQVGVTVADCAGEAVPASWVSNTYTGNGHTIMFDWSDPNGKLEFDTQAYDYKYWGGSFNAVYFNDGTDNYKLTRKTSNGGYILYKVNGSTETQVATLKHEANITVALFAGKYKSVKNKANNVSEIWIYESGNGYIVMGNSKTKYAMTNEDYFKVTFNAGTGMLKYIEYESGSSSNYYNLTLNLDDDGKAKSINVSYKGATSVEYAFYAESGDEIPEKLPLPLGMEFVSSETTVTLVSNSTGGQYWNGSADVNIIAYNKAENYYTVKNGNLTYTIELTGAGDDTQIKVFNEEHTNLLFTLAKKQLRVDDLKTDGTDITVPVADFDGNYYYFKMVEETGMYTINSAKSALYIYYNQYDIESGNFNYVNMIDCDSVKLPCTVELKEGTYIVLSTMNYSSKPSKVSFSVEKYVSSGIGTGTQSDPYKMTDLGELEVPLANGNTCYVTFTAPEDGNYVFNLPHNDLDSSNANNYYQIMWTVDGVKYGYDDGAWYYYYAGEQVGSMLNASVYITKPEIQKTLTAGQSVNLVFKQNGWGAETLYFEVTKAGSGTVVVKPDGSEENPYVIDEIGTLNVSLSKAGSVCYVKATAPAGEDMVLYTGAFDNWGAPGYGYFTYNDVKYGYEYVNGKYNQLRNFYLVIPAGQSVTVQVALANEYDYTDSFPVIMSIDSTKDATTLDFALVSGATYAANSTFSGNKNFFVTSTKGDNLEITAGAAFSVIPLFGESIQATSTNGKYTVSLAAGSNFYFTVISETSQQFTFTVDAQPGSQENPLEVTLNNRNLQYMSATQVSRGATVYLVSKVSATFANMRSNSSTLTVNGVDVGSKSFELKVGDILVYTNNSSDNSVWLKAVIADEYRNKEYTFTDNGVEKTLTVTGNDTFKIETEVDGTVTSVNYDLVTQVGNVYTFEVHNDSTSTVTFTVGDTLKLNDFTLTEKGTAEVTVGGTYSGQCGDVIITISWDGESTEGTYSYYNPNEYGDSSSLPVTITKQADGSYSYADADAYWATGTFTIDGENLVLSDDYYGSATLTKQG